MRTLLAVLLLSCGEASASAEEREIRGQQPAIRTIREAFKADATEVNYSDVTLDSEQLRKLLDPKFVRDVVGAMPPGREARLNIRAELPEGRQMEMRVTRTEDNEQRLRLRGVIFEDPQDARRLVDTLNSDFERVEIRGFDNAGHRVRLESRDGRMTRDDMRRDHAGPARGSDDPQRQERRSRMDRERLERQDRPERGPERDRMERGDRSGGNSGPGR